MYYETNESELPFEESKLRVLGGCAEGLATSIGVEKAPKIIGGNISASLPENGVASSSVELAMIGKVSVSFSPAWLMRLNLIWLPRWERMKKPNG